jgi:hypothetical protein
VALLRRVLVDEELEEGSPAANILDFMATMLVEKAGEELQVNGCDYSLISIHSSSSIRIRMFCVCYRKK